MVSVNSTNTSRSILTRSAGAVVDICIERKATKIHVGYSDRRFRIVVAAHRLLSSAVRSRGGSNCDTFDAPAGPQKDVTQKCNLSLHSLGSLSAFDWGGVGGEQSD